jgi:hypothetical protein
MGIMKLAVVTKRFVLVVLLASIFVALSSAFSIQEATASRRPLPAECRISRRCYREQEQVDVKEKWDISSSRPIFVPAVVLPLLLTFMIAVLPAQASDTAVIAANNFNNVYADPLHPLCERKMEVAKDGTTFHYSGKAVGEPSKDDDPTGVFVRGCSQTEIQQYTSRQEAFDGLVLGGGKRNSLEVADGTVQKNLEGKNEVVKKPMSTAIGEFVIFSYITFSGLAGVKGIVDAYKRKQQEQK